MPKLRLHFDNLPLMEAAVRASFEKPIALSYSVVNAVAAELRPSFPVLTEPKQIEVAPGAAESTFEFGPGFLPGAVYTGDDRGISVSVHPEVVVVRWLKQPALSEGPYPRYAALREALWAAVEALGTACGNDYSGITVVNMSYVNFIPMPDSSTSIGEYFDRGAWLQAMARAKHVRKLEGAWSEDDKLDVRFALEQVTARLDDGVSQGYRLTTAAGLRLASSTDARSGLEQVHDKLQQFFWTLISDRAKEEWQGREDQDAGNDG